MLRAGLVEEVEGVLARGVAPDAPGLDAVGYRQVVGFLRGELSRATLPEAIASATHRYAKRQETWFRHQLVGHSVITLDATASPPSLADLIAQLWEERGR
jgi:tRNA dimethylallyltransferase